MAGPRRAFNDLPTQLRSFLDSEEEFQEIQNVFFIFFKKIKTDLESKTNIVDAARAYVILEYIKSELEQFSKSFSPIHQEHKTKTIPKLFEGVGIPALPLDEGFTVSVNPKFFCSIKPEFKYEAFGWLKENNLEDIIQPAVNPKTLVSAVQELIETEGTEPPKEYFTSFVQMQAKCIKGKVSKKTISKEEDYFNEEPFDLLKEE